MAGAGVDGALADRRPARRLLLAALAALCLLVTGLAHGLPRADAPAGPAAGAAPSSPAGVGRTSMEAPQTDGVVRAAPLAVVPAPAGPATGALPAGGALVAPHLLAQPQTRPPTARLGAAAPGAPGSRAPPATTGT